MPIFEFRCTECNERFEALRLSAEPAALRCPRCGGGRAERLISAFAVGRSRAPVPPPCPCGSADCSCRNG